MPNTMLPSSHISIAIARPAERVYAFVADPRNLPRWAAGLATSEVQPEGDAWIAQAPVGRVSIRFATQNNLGVLDHDVELESGQVFHNPMRVIVNGDGSEFIFTLLRQPTVTDEQFAADTRAIRADVRTLKRLLEAS